MNSTGQQSGFPRLNAGQVGILIAIVLAAAMTTFYTRMLSTSLPDLRGVWGLSVDEGSVLNTVATAPQLLIAPVLPWFLSALGMRRILVSAAAAFVLISFTIPFITGYVPLLAAHAVMGLLLGCFVTATILITLKYLPPPWWIVAFAFFTFRVSLATNTGVSLGALYMEHLGWEWIYWQSSGIMLIYLALFHFFMPAGETRKDMLEDLDLSGMAFFCLGAMLLYIGLDQGERLGWLDSGFITVCLFGGAALLLGFCLNEAMVKRPWASPRLFANRNIIVGVVMIGVYIFMLTANSLLITRFLDTIQGLKPLQSGNALLLVALLQMLVTPFCIVCLQRIDPRLVCAFGVVAMAAACYQGTLVTADWAAADFIPMALLFAVGHPFVFLPQLAICIAGFETHTAPRLLAYVQLARVFAPALNGALLVLFLRQRKDAHSTFLSSHLTGNDPVVGGFLDSGGTLSTLKSMVSLEANVLSFQDAFALCFWIAMASLAMLALVRALKPTPLSPVQVHPQPASSPNAQAAR